MSFLPTNFTVPKYRIHVLFIFVTLTPYMESSSQLVPNKCLTDSNKFSKTSRIDSIMYPHPH